MLGHQNGRYSKRQLRGFDMQAYCLKCRTKREMRNPQQVTLKNGRPATQGACPVCGTKMYRIGKG
jgi:Zn finger protein HypA/HybF involved in hydrogenase expression